jgi:hypothetical protein
VSEAARIIADMQCKDTPFFAKEWDQAGCMERAELLQQPTMLREILKAYGNLLSAFH